MATPRPRKAAPPSFWQTARANRYVQLAGQLFILWLLPFLILTGSFFSIILGNNNFLEVFPSELVFPTLMHAATALIIAIVVRWVRRPTNLGAKLLVTTLLGLMMVGYNNRLEQLAPTFKAVIPILPSADADALAVISLLLLAIMLALALWLGRLFERLQRGRAQLQSSNIVGGLLIVALVMSLGTIRGLYATMSTVSSQAKVAPQPFASPPGFAAADKPDIYYIVLDRYANQSVLGNQLNYDNSDFINTLTANDYTVNPTAHSSYPYTAMSIASTINADYTAQYVAPYKNSDIQARLLYHNLIYQSSTIKALKDVGYKYYTVGSWYAASSRAPLADNNYMWDHLFSLFGREKRLRDLEAVEFAKSPFNAFAKVSWPHWPMHIQDRSQLDDVRAQLQILNQLTTQPSSGGRLIFAHLLVPHEPYNFNADGSLATATAEDNVGQSVRNKYLGQVGFINTQMKQIVSNIQQQSGGKAVVIFNSDEGPYPQFINSTGLDPSGEGAVEGGVIPGDMSKWNQDWLHMKFGVLQAVHIPAATPEDLANLTNVNIFRIILNRYAGYGLPYLPDCHYALNRGSQYEYNYIDVTEQINGIARPECAQWQSQP